jgi:hypothetical protein
MDISMITAGSKIFRKSTKPPNLAAHNSQRQRAGAPEKTPKYDPAVTLSDESYNRRGSIRDLLPRFSRCIQSFCNEMFAAMQERTPQPLRASLQRPRVKR